MSDTLTPHTILHTLPTVALPRSVWCYTQVGSTMDTVREQLRQTEDHSVPMLVLAEEQTAGRGRKQRPWAAPPGSALLFSLGLRPHWLPLARVPSLVWMAGVALCEGISETTGLHPRLKWPNDVVLVGEKQADGTPTLAKIAGILLETGSSGTGVAWAIIGCGINVSASPPLDTPLRYPATSLAAAAGRAIARLPLLRSILVRMDTWYTRLEQGADESLFVAWRDLLVTIGQQVQVDTADGPLAGYAEAVEPSGALRVRDADGNVHLVTSGDVS